MIETSFCDICNKETHNIRTTVKDNKFTYDAVICQECGKIKPKDTKDLLLEIDQEEEAKFDYTIDKTPNVYVKPKNNKAQDINNPTCPKCGSTAIHPVQKGFSLITGFVGSGKTLNYCANCGHKWNPKK